MLAFRTRNPKYTLTKFVFYFISIFPFNITIHYSFPNSANRVTTQLPTMTRFRRFHITIIEEEEEPLLYHYSTSPLFFTQETLTFPSFSYRQLQKQHHLTTHFCFHTLNGRKYTWTAEIKGEEKDGFDRKYKWIADLVEEEKKKKKKLKSLKWTAEIKGKGKESGSLRKYTFQVGSSDDDAERKTEKVKEKKTEKVKKEEKKKGSGRLRIVEIEEANDTAHRDVVLTQAFSKRLRAVQNDRGKKKELSPQDAALLIQISFKAYLIRRSKTLRALRELAVAKSKLKELRAQFNNFTYRRRVARDSEECQRFSEKVIVLLLTVDAIEGADLMVRSSKKSMVDELEAMLDVIDPQPDERSLSFKRRQFDMPDRVIRKEIEEGVAQVVQMLDEADL